MPLPNRHRTETRLAIVVLLAAGLWIHPGCARHYFEGTLYTYTDVDESYYQSGTGVIDKTMTAFDPLIIIHSQEFWSTYEERNPFLPEKKLQTIRSSLRFTSIETLQFQGDRVAKFTIQIEDADQESFQTLWPTYDQVYQQLRNRYGSGDSEVIKFLRGRRMMLEQEYLSAESTYADAPNPQSNRILEIARNNLSQIDERLRNLTPPTYPYRHGQLVYELMEIDEVNKG